MKTGRRDGRISMANEALSNIPAPFFNFSQLKDSFASKGLNVVDLVVLSGTCQSKSARSITMQCNNISIFLQILYVDHPMVQVRILLE